VAGVLLAAKPGSFRARKTSDSSNAGSSRDDSHPSCRFVAAWALDHAGTHQVDREVAWEWLPLGWSPGLSVASRQALRAGFLDAKLPAKMA